MLLQKSVKRKRYVYLFELDSVRTSYKDAIAASTALTRELMDYRTCIVLTYNQIGDNPNFLRWLSNEKARNTVLQLFQHDRLKIHRYSFYNGLIDYLVQALDKSIDGESSAAFIFSSLPVLNDGWYTTPDDEGHTQKSEVLRSLRDALAGNDYSAFDRPDSKRLFKSNEDRLAIQGFLQTMLSISLIPGLYLDSKRSGESKSLSEILVDASWILKNDFGGAYESLKSTLNAAMGDVNSPNARSVLYHWLDIESNCPCAQVRYHCRDVIDLAYNFACSDSINAPGLSYSFDNLRIRLQHLVKSWNHNRECVCLKSDNEVNPPWESLQRIDSFAYLRGDNCWSVGTFYRHFIMISFLRPIRVFVHLVALLAAGTVVDWVLDFGLDGLAGIVLPTFVLAVVVDIINRVLDWLLGSPSYGDVGANLRHAITDSRLIAWYRNGAVDEGMFVRINTRRDTGQLSTNPFAIVLLPFILIKNSLMESCKLFYPEVKSETKDNGNDE